MKHSCCGIQLGFFRFLSAGYFCNRPAHTHRLIRMRHQFLLHAHTLTQFYNSSCTLLIFIDSLVASLNTSRTIVMDFSCNCASILLMLTVVWGFHYSCCERFGTFGFDLHHRYSDTVKGILGLDGLPEKGSIDYYAAMAHRDHLIRGRHLTSSTPLTFSGGNKTSLIDSLGYLLYTNVTVGSPGLSFLVALDTGSSLFWLPCDCKQCCNTKSAQVRYSPSNSSTSATVSCNSDICVGLQEYQCTSAAPYVCLYQYNYESNDTYSSGSMVEDILHLTTDDSQLEAVNAQIPFGCGMVQGGAFLSGAAAPNGLFGLGMDDISVPSVLSSQGLTANSFSMCFGPNGTGRISFGDTGDSVQVQTPFNLDQSYPAYNVTVSQITVGNNATGVSFTAIFDSGTSFTNLQDPAYTIITESFNSQVQQTEHFVLPPFEYCYKISNFRPPTVNLTMKGGDKFYVTEPIELFSVKGGGSVYCLAITKAADNDINTIGQNFMTGYNIVFDRGNMVLGWEASNCYAAEPKSSASPHNTKEAFAAFLFVFLVYSALI